MGVIRKRNKRQYYVQEGTKFIENQKNITIQSCFCIIHGMMRMTPYHHFTTYHESSISKQDIIHQNAKRFNEDSVAFDLDLQDLENNIIQSALEMVAPNIAQDDRTTHVQGSCTLQNEQQEKQDTIDTVCHGNTRNKRDTVCMLYAKAAKRQDMNFQDYCRHICTLNKDQCHIVMYNRAWCKSYINAVRQGKKQVGFRIFLSGPGGKGPGKSHVVSLLQRDMSHFFKHTVKPDDD